MVEKIAECGETARIWRRFVFVRDRTGSVCYQEGGGWRGPRAGHVFYVSRRHVLPALRAFVCHRITLHASSNVCYVYYDVRL